MNDSEKRAQKIMAILGAILVIWFALTIAPYVSGGLPAILAGFSEALAHPFKISVCEYTLKTILICLVFYVIAVGAILSSAHNYRNGIEHGSAIWGNIEEICKKYMDKLFMFNLLLTQHVRMSINNRAYRRNRNVVVIGGSGAGKSLMYVIANLLQGNTSFVVLDPKGELLRTVGAFLKKIHYRIKVLNLLHMNESDCYNPFVYLKTESDVQKLTTNFFKATTPKDAQSTDPFWDTAAKMLLSALIFYLLSEAPPEEQNFEMVVEMLRAAAVSEENPDAMSPVDKLFLELEAKDPHHIAVKYYKDYKKGAGKTLKSIQVTLASRLEKFNIEELAKLTITDDMDLASMGEKKTALFAVIPDSDTSFNFIVSMLYTQLFQQLFELADNKYHGELPVPVHFLMDEFSNVALPDDFDKILSVMRSRGVSVSIILQNLAQLKALFEKKWESIIGNCDELLYLGGNEQSTHEYISKQLGKQTIDINTYGKSKGRNGSYTKNYQKMGRELMTPDEVRMLDNKYALLFIRGERPIMDLKIDTFNLPNAKYTPLKGGPAYDHAKLDNVVGSLKIDMTEVKNDDDSDSDDEFLLEFDPEEISGNESQD